MGNPEQINVPVLSVLLHLSQRLLQLHLALLHVSQLLLHLLHQRLLLLHICMGEAPHKDAAGGRPEELQGQRSASLYAA